GQAVQLGLGAGDLVLTGLTVLGDPVQLLLGAAADVAHGDPGVLPLRLGELDVVAAALLGQRGQHDPDDVAVVARVHSQVRLPQRLLDRGHRALVVGADEHGAGLLDGDRGELLQRGGSTVVVHLDLLEHAGVGTSGADSGEVLSGHLDGLVHLLLGFEKGVVDDACSLLGWGTGSDVTIVTISAPRGAAATLHGVPMPITRIVRWLSRHSASAMESTTRRSRPMASSKVR